ncbi:chemotaxis regulatory protein ChePep-like [Pseudorasbora parva]|uniref:chemotaxis regulatory protein ChePep-like n=1 Tax=Pseudorasbora parva TaxID=51549 RepID=UPI00351E9A8A
MEFIKEESEDIKMEFIKEESEDIKMEFIKEESEDVKIEETLRVKDEETEEQTDLMVLKEESEVLKEMEEKDQIQKKDFITREIPFSCSQADKTLSQKKAKNMGSRSTFTCQQCGNGFTLKKKP